MDLIDGASVQRHEEQISVRAGLDVGDDAEVTADEQTVALGQIVEGQIVSHAILEAGIVYADAAPVAGEIEMKQRPAVRFWHRHADEEIANELRSEAGCRGAGERQRLTAENELDPLGLLLLSESSNV